MALHLFHTNNDAYLPEKVCQSRLKNINLEYLPDKHSNKKHFRFLAIFVKFLVTSPYNRLV